MNNLIFFTFEDCSPCRDALPVAKAVVREEMAKMEIVDIFRDKNRFREIGNEDIYMFPTVCTIDDGNLGRCVRGFASEESYRRQLKELLEE